MVSCSVINYWELSVPRSRRSPDSRKHVCSTTNLALVLAWAVAGGEEAPVDKFPVSDCKCWAAQGQCETNADWMGYSCAGSCELQTAWDTFVQNGGAAGAEARVRELNRELETQRLLAKDGDVAKKRVEELEAKLKQREKETTMEHAAAQARITDLEKKLVETSSGVGTAAPLDDRCPNAAVSQDLAALEATQAAAAERITKLEERLSQQDAEHEATVRKIKEESDLRERGILAKVEILENILAEAKRRKAAHAPHIEPANETVGAVNAPQTLVDAKQGGNSPHPSTEPEPRHAAQSTDTAATDAPNNGDGGETSGRSSLAEWWAALSDFVNKSMVQASELCSKASEVFQERVVPAFGRTTTRAMALARRAFDQAGEYIGWAIVQAQTRFKALSESKQFAGRPATLALLGVLVLICVFLVLYLCRRILWFAFGPVRMVFRCLCCLCRRRKQDDLAAASFSNIPGRGRGQEFDNKGEPSIEDMRRELMSSRPAPGLRTPPPPSSLGGGPMGQPVFSPALPVPPRPQAGVRPPPGPPPGSATPMSVMTPNGIGGVSPRFAAPSPASSAFAKPAAQFRPSPPSNLGPRPAPPQTPAGGAEEDVFADLSNA